MSVSERSQHLGKRISEGRASLGGKKTYMAAAETRFRGFRALERGRRVGIGRSATCVRVDDAPAYTGNSSRSRRARTFHS
jgi:hypothetical protein